MTPGAFLGRIRTVLDTVGVPYMLTGSFASSEFGAPRATHDLDIVIAPTHGQLLELVRQFAPDRYYVSEAAAIDAFERGGQFNVIEVASGWKVDFILRKARAFSVTEFARRRPATIAGQEVVAVTPEDIIIAKLEWAMLGSSERQLDDVAGMLRMGGARLDCDYVTRWVTELGLADQWREALRRAELT